MSFAYLYLLRVPIMGGLVLLLFAPLALTRSPVSLLLRGMFDLEPAGLAIVTFLALIAGTACAVTTEMVLRYGSMRFRVKRLPPMLLRVIRGAAGTALDIRLFTILNVAFYGVCASVLIAGAVHASRGSPWLRGLAVVGGSAVFGMVFAFAFDRWRRAQSAVARFGAALFLWTPAGYLTRRAIRATSQSLGTSPVDDRTLLPGHGLLMVTTGVTFAAYAFFGLVKWLSMGCADTRGWYCGLVETDALEAGRRLAAPYIPTLACVLVLIALLVYVLAGLAFLLDRFRVPLLVPIAILASAMAGWPQADYYYDATPATRAVETITAAHIFPHVSGDRAILVTASGGGIHAAGWAAAVLTSFADDPQLGDAFRRSVAMLSTVSGGSVGAMYFADWMRHRTSREKPSAYDNVFIPATVSSLDDIAWGLVYPDLLRVVAPFLVRMDRGMAAERAWQRVMPTVGDSFRAWRDAAVAGRMPAVIFNATAVDTGSRVAIGTTDIRPGRGRVNFSNLYPNLDLRAVTAARLSATFTYVSPAARVDQVIRLRERHALVDWVHAALDAPAHAPVRLPAHVLVLQIRGPGTLEDSDAGGGRGLLYQAAAPIATMLGVWSSAQIAHNNTELRLLCRAASDRAVMENVVFQFPDGDTPLSWHLTRAERQDVWHALWHAKLVKMREHVRRFLEGGFAAVGTSCGQFEEDAGELMR